MFLFGFEISGKISEKYVNTNMYMYAHWMLKVDYVQLLTGH